MPFNAMDLFQAGGQLGQASAGPATYGVNNMMDLFNKMQTLGIQTRMMMNQEYMKQMMLNQTDPNRIVTQLRINKAMGENPTGQPGQVVSQDNSQPQPQNAGSSSGAVVTQGGMVPKSQSSTDILGNTQTWDNPAFAAADQQYKDALASNQKFASANSMISNLMHPMAAAHKQIGGGGLLPGTVGSAAKFVGSIPSTDAIGSFNTATKDFQTNQAMQFTGNNGGIAKLVSYFGKDSIPSLGQSPENNVAVLAQQRINDYALHKAHSASPYSMMPFDKLDENQIQDIIDTARNPNTVSTEERQVITNYTKQEFAKAQRDVESEGIQTNPISQMVSGVTSKIPYSGFSQQQTQQPKSALHQAVTKSRYSLNQVIPVGNKNYRVIGLSDPNDPDLELVK